MTGKSDYIIEVFTEGATKPHWSATDPDIDRANRLADRYRDRIRANGWNMRVSVRER